MRRSVVLAVGATFAACGGGAPLSSHPVGTATASVAVTAAPSADAFAAALLPALPHRTPLGEVVPTPLVISEIVPEWGDESVVALHQFADERLGYAQRIDDKTRTLGPEIVLDDEPLLGAFARGDDLLLATTHAGSICLTTYRDGAITSRGCELRHGDALVPFGAGFMSLWSEPADEAIEKRAKPVVPPREPAPRVRKKPPQHGHAEPKVAASPKKLAVVRQLVSADGALDGDDAVTDFTFTSPMPGMAIVGATSSGERARVLFYEYTGQAKGRPKQVIGKSRLALASLDEKGAYDPASRKAFPDDDLMFGFLANHQDPRVVPTSRGALYLGLTSPHGKCEAAVVAPFFMAMIPNDALCGVRPSAYFDIAAAVRDAQKGGNPGSGVAVPEEPRVDPALKGARRAFGQPAFDPAHAAFFGDRAYALVSATGSAPDRVVRFADPSTLEDVPRPLVASQLRIAWGAFAPDGAGVASIDGRVVTVSASGAVEGGPRVDASFGLFARSDVASVERSLATRIGDAFYQSRGTLRQLTPDDGAEPIVKLTDDAAVVVGGDKAGLVLELAGDTLSVRRFDPPRALAAPLRLKAPVTVGFDAVPRLAGGAIVAGAKRSDPTHVVAFAIDDHGHATDTTDAGLTLTLGNPSVRLTPLPGGGALLTDMDRTHVVWLADDATLLAAAPWPAGSAHAQCVDGRPAPTEVPTPTPGLFRHVDDLAADGSCVTGDFAWARDGSLRWFGSTSRAPHSRAELGLLPGTVAAPASDHPARAFNDSPAPPQPACPADMVSIAGSYCVDRYEGTLVDRASGFWLSPDYSATESFMNVALTEWSTKRERTGDLFARAMPLPSLPSFEVGKTLEPVAVNRAHVRPSGYVTGITAKAACEAAGKRLCTLDEWHRACRGADNRQFPYGDAYEDGVCNVNREAHPAAMLHGHSSLGHLDPRLDRVVATGGPLMHLTGESPACASRWGDDAVYDMVGNLDEWVDEKSGAFAGGFFSRGTKNGCEALVDAHPLGYLDYSTGVRCCRDPL